MVVAAPVHAETAALLIGVGVYLKNPAAPPSKEGNQSLRALDGPPRDVEVLKRVLTDTWKVPAANVRTLVDAQATRAAILREIAALEARTRPGDDVFIYYSGHGTSGLYEKTVGIGESSGAVVPTDFAGLDAPAERQLESLIIGRRDLRPLLSRLDAGGRNVTVIFDSCYSGQSARSAGELRNRSGAPADRPVPRFAGTASTTLIDDIMRAGQGAFRPAEPYPYSRVVYMSAASEGEVATDIAAHLVGSYPTFDGLPHGAFTDALLRVMSGKLPADYDRDGRVTIREAHRAIGDFLNSRSFAQTPQILPALLEDNHALGQRTLGPQTGSAAAPMRTELTPLRVHVAPRNMPAQVQQALRSTPGVSIVADEKDAAIRAYVDGTMIKLESATYDALTELAVDDGASVVKVISQYAWAHRLRLLGERGQRAALPFEMSPSRFGGNFLIGTKVDFVAKPERPGALLLVNVDADGLLSVLYPKDASEIAASRSPRAFVKIEGTTVTPPVGTDQVLVFAFDTEPPELAKLLDTVRIGANHPKAATLEQLLTSQAGRFSFARAELRTLAPPSK